MDQTAFSGRLLPGERMIWTGQPGQGVLFTPRDFFLVPFSLLWCGFVVFWIAMAARTGTTFYLFGIPFLIFGLFFVAGRFVADAWLRRGIHYALTDRRILIARSGPFSNFTAVSLDRLPDARLSERGDGRGTIRFGQAPPMWGGGGYGIWTPSLDATPQFLAIDDARRVFDLVQRAPGQRA